MDYGQWDFGVRLVVPPNRRGVEAQNVAYGGQSGVAVRLWIRRFDGFQRPV